MRVAMIAPPSIGVISGGVRTQVLQTSRYLSEFGIEPFFYDQWMENALQNVRGAHIFGSGITNLDMARRLHEMKIPFVVSPVVYSNHSSSFVKTARTIERMIRKGYSGIWSDYAVTSEICSLAELVLPNTGDEKKLIIEGFGISEKKVCVIPNGVSEFYAQASPDLFVQKYGIQDFILCVGNFAAKRKNLERLLQACKTIDTPIVLIGKLGTHDLGLKCKAIIDTMDQVLQLDALPSEDPILASAYAASKVFVLPSYFETPGIAAMEAGLAGANIVITPYGGTKEYFMGDAVYCEPESVESISKALQKALSLPKSEHLRTRLYETYTWRKVSEATARAYKTIWEI